MRITLSSWAVARLLLVSLSLAPPLGCAGRRPPSSPVVPADPASPIDAALRPGDGVRVKIWREPELSGEFMVNEDGYIVLPLLGERRVIGISAAVVQKQLVADYKEFLENPSVSVTALRRISILGEVRDPGLYPVDPTMSLTEALAMAGGVIPSGDQDNIRVVRDGKVLRRRLDVMMRLGSTPIQSGDQIVVGKKGGFNYGLVFSSTGLLIGILAIVLR